MVVRCSHREPQSRESRQPQTLLRQAGRIGAENVMALRAVGRSPPRKRCDHNASLQSILDRCVAVEQTAAAIQVPTIVIVRRFAGVTTVFASISARYVWPFA